MFSWDLWEIHPAKEQMKPTEILNKVTYKPLNQLSRCIRNPKIKLPRKRAMESYTKSHAKIATRCTNEKALWLRHIIASLKIILILRTLKLSTVPRICIDGHVHIPVYINFFKSTQQSICFYRSRCKFFHMFSDKLIPIII